MRKSKAIKLLKQQIEKINNDNTHKDFLLVIQIKTYIQLLFGEKSDQFNYINSFSFPYYVENKEPDKTTSKYLEMSKNSLIKFLTNCIEILQAKGVEKNGNILTNVGNSTIIGVITFLIPSLLSVGYLFGVSTTDSKNVELRQENKQLIKEKNELTDSLTTIRTTFNKTNKISN